MRDIGVGLIGYGLGGRAFHAPYVQVTQGLSLRAVVSRDVSKVRADLPGMEVVPNVPALLARSDIDLVIVSSPDGFHAEHALAALRAGKHVLVDKPFATSLADARAVAEEAHARGRLLTVFHNRRWDADFLTLRRLIEQGVLGEVVEFESRFDRWRPVPAEVWKETREGGSWLDLGPHLIDQALCLFGRPDAITADMAILRGGAPAYDYFTAILRYPRRRVLLHSSKLAAGHGLRFAVHGTRGSWIKHGVDPQEAATVSGRPPGGDDWGVDPTLGMLTLGADLSAPVPSANESGDYRLFWQALVRAIRGEAPNPVPPEAALTVMEVLEAGLRSCEARREVAF
ncbi:MAG: oxidoreductase [Novosphingobium sp.]